MGTNIVPISALPETLDPLNGDEDFPIVQGGVTKRIKTFRALAFTLPEWRSDVIYAENAVITYNGNLWRSLTGSNVGNTPSSASEYWIQTAVTPSIDIQGDNLNHADGRFVRLNGQTFYQDWATYGHRLTVIDPVSMTIVSSAIYGTFSGTASLITALNAVPGNYVVTLVSCGQITIDGALRTALAARGGRSAGAPGSGAISHVFIGQAGLQPGEGYEVYDTTASLRQQCYVSETGIVKQGKEGPIGNPVIVQGSVDASAWHTGLLTGDVYMRTSEDNGATWSDAVRILGEDGESGKFTNFKFAKNTSQSTPPSYTANADNPGSNWFDGPQTLSGGEFQWFIKSNWRDTVRLDNWTAPVRLSGETGETGAAGTNNAMVLLYKRSASAPTKPSTSSTFTFATGVLAGHDNGWTQAIPAVNGQPCWVIAASASSNTATDTILPAEWSDQVKMVEDGTDGTDGLNSATVKLYKRSVATPSVPTTTSTYTFSTGVLTGHDNGWTQVETTDDLSPLWVISAVAVSNASTDTIASGEWSTPVKFVVGQGVSPGTADLVAEYTIEDLADMPFTVTQDQGPSGFGTLGGTVQDISDGNGTTFNKTAGTGWGSGRFYSRYAIGPGARATAQIKNAGIPMMLGLTSNPAKWTNFNSLDFACYINGGGNLALYIAGTGYGNISTYAYNDIIDVVYDGINVLMRKNGTSFWSQYVGPGKSYYLDSDSYQNGNYLANILFTTDGLSYFQDFASGVDGWSGTGGASGGILNIPNTSVATKLLTVPLGHKIAIRARKNTSRAMTLDFGTAYARPSVTIQETGSWFIWEWVNDAFSTTQSVTIYLLSRQAGDLLEIDWIYIGQGYQPAIADTSRNKFSMFLYCGVPVIGKSGKGVAFGGVGYGMAILPAGTKSLSLWFKIPTGGLASGYAAIVSGGSVTSYNNLWLLSAGNITGAYGDESLSLDVFNYLGTNILTMHVRLGHTYFADSAWHHLTIRFGGVNNAILVDGFPQQVTFQNGSASTDASGPFGTGAYFGKYAYFSSITSASVAIDEFHAYQRPLADAEALWLYANPGNVPAQAVENAKAAAVASAPKYLGKWLDTAPVPGNIGDTYTRYSTTSGATNRGVFRWNGASWDRTEDSQYLVGQAIDDISQIITYKNASGSAIYGSAADYSGDSTVQATFGFFWLAVIQQLQASVIKAIGMTVDGSNNVTAGMEIDLVNSRIRSPQFRARGKAGDGDPLSLGPVGAPTLRAKEDGTLQIGSMTINPAGVVSDTTVLGILRPKMLYSSAHRISITASPQTYDIYTVSYATGDTYKVRRTQRITIEIGGETFSFLSLETQASASAPASCPISGVAITSVTQSGGPFTTLYILRATVTGRSGQLLNVFREQLSAQEGPTSLPSDFD